MLIKPELEGFYPIDWQELSWMIRFKRVGPPIDPTFGCIKAERDRGYRWLEEIALPPKPSAE